VAILPTYGLLNLRNTMTNSIQLSNHRSDVSPSPDARFIDTPPSVTIPNNEDMFHRSSYFALGDQEKLSPNSIYSGDSPETHLPSPPTMTTITFTTFKHLPVPLPVLPWLQIISLANKAIERLLGIDPVDAAASIER